MKPNQSRSAPNDYYYSRIFILNAKQELEKLLEVMEDCDDKKLQYHLSEAISLVSKAWHLRSVTQGKFESLTSDDIKSLRCSVPDLNAISGDMKIVNSDWSI